MRLEPRPLSGSIMDGAAILSQDVRWLLCGTQILQRIMDGAAILSQDVRRLLCGTQILQRIMDGAAILSQDVRRLLCGPNSRAGRDTCER